MHTTFCRRCGRPNEPAALICRDCGETLTPEDRPDGAAGPAPAGAGFAPTPQTYVPPFETVGDVLKPTFRLYKENFGLVAKIVLVVAVPLALVEYLATNAPRLALEGPSWLFGHFLELLMNGALTYAVYDYARRGVNATLAEAYEVGFRKWLKVFAVTLVSTVVITIGMVLLVVPGIIFSVMFALVVPLVVLGDRGVGEAFTESAALTKGYRWQIFATYFVVGVIMFGLTLLSAGSFLGTEDESDATLFTVLLSLTLHLIQSMLVVLSVFIYLGVYERRRRASPPRFQPGAER